MKKNWYFYLIAVLLLLPIFILRDYTTANELRYLSIMEQAIRDGSFFTFYNHEVVYADKPPLFFWAMMLLRWISGGNYLWLFGLLTMIPVGVIFYVMNRWCFDAKRAGAPMWALMTSIMFLGGAVVMRMDMMMTMFIVLSLWTFFKMYTGKGRPRDRYLLPVYVFLAVFSKGAVGILMPLTVIAVFLAMQGQWRQMGVYWGWRTWGVLLGLSAVWFGATYAEGGAEYLNNLLFKQTVGRGVNSFHHAEPWWYYLRSIWYMAAPWSLFVLVMFVKAFRERLWDMRTKFLAITVGTTLVVMSIVSSKIDIYLLPIYPFMIYFAFLVLDRVRVDGWVKASLIIPAAVMALAVVVFPFCGDLLPEPTRHIAALYVGLSVLSGAAALAIVMIVRSRIRVAAMLIGGGMLACIFCCSPALETYNKYLGVSELASRGKQIAMEKGITRYAVLGFRGENMDVHLGTQLEKIDDIEQLDSLINSGTPTVLFLHRRQRDTTQLPQLGRGEKIASSHWIYVLNER